MAADQHLRIAIVYDDLTQMGGGERSIRTTSKSFATRARCAGPFASGRTTTSFGMPPRPRGEPPEDFHLVVSRLVYAKRIDLAVKAFARLDRKLVIIGQGERLPHLTKMGGRARGSVRRRSRGRAPGLLHLGDRG